MTARDWIVGVLLVAGIGVTVLAALAMLRVGDVFDRLHLTGPVTSLGAPAIGLALIIANGASLASAEVAATVVLIAVSGPAMTTAVARVAAQRARGEEQEAPE